MYQFLIFYICSIISVIVQIYATSKIMNLQIVCNKKIAILIINIISILISYLFSISDSFIRVILTFGLVITTNYILFHAEWKKTIITTFIVNTMFAISEILFSLFTMFILKIDATNYGLKFFGSLISNISISAIVFFFLKIPFLMDILKKMINISQNRIIIYIISFLGIMISALSLYSSYFKLSSSELLFVMLLYILIYLFIVYKFFDEKNMRENIENKNNLLIENISEYEKIIEVQKIEAHENKNQLRIIKGMIKDNNNELNEYIDTLLNEHKKKDKDLMNQVQNIPNSGLSALIYSKLLGLSKEFNINLIVSRTVTAKKMSLISNETNVDIYKILGVFLDNAIEAANLTEDKILGIELFVENNQFNIIISNSFIDIIDLEIIDEPKYSTKGQNRGYGLTLVKSILSKNTLIKNRRKISNNIFSQVLVVSLLKKE